MDKHIHTADTPKVLVVITDLSRLDEVKDALSWTHQKFMYTIKAKGSAKSDILNLLGLSGNQKVIVLSLIPGAKSNEALQALKHRLDLRRPGGGIAFLILLSGMSNLANKHPEFLQHNNQKHTVVADETPAERTEIKMSLPHDEQASPKYDMILTVINMGYSDELLEAAGRAGSRGGTIVHARRSGLEEAMKLFGISLQSEKEIVAIVVEREKRNDVMKAINNACGIDTEAAGIVLSMRVEDVAGIREA